ncbi:MAG TPA: zinc ribbon domain-containing protein [Limnochordia bacterium]|nr:zinc ribbon domain-containing protein [Limnochordia bacterium]
MPIYEYRCPNCGRFELQQSIKDDKLSTCPTCSAPVERLIAKNIGIIFKGPGFYINDSRNDAKNGAADSPAAESSAS